MKRALAIVASASLLVTAGCSRDKVEPGQARLTFSGRVLVAPEGEEYSVARSSQTLHSGDRVKVLTGTAKLALAAKASVELRAGSEMRVEREPLLLAGEALALSGSDELGIRSGTAKAEIDGVARLARSLAFSVSTYRGSTRLSSTGRSITVPALRRAASPASGQLPLRPDPVKAEASDAWDRRFLGVAIDLNDQLERRSQGLTAQLPPSDGRTVGFFRQVLPDLEGEDDFTAQLMDPTRAPGETLVGASIALEGERDSFLGRWASVFSFRNDGAQWGIVALDQAVEDVPGLTGRIDAAIALAPLRFAANGILAAGPTFGGGGGGNTPQPGPGGPGGGPGGGGNPTTPTTQPPRPVEPPPTGTPADPLADAVADVIDQLLTPFNPVP
jgi:hypothetical protein